MKKLKILAVSLVTTLSLIGLIVLGAKVFTYDNLVFVQDSFAARGYQRSELVNSAAQDLSLTKYGNQLVNASRTEILDANNFNLACDNNGEKEDSYLLGCYWNRRIYVYDIKNDDLVGADEVTLAHEVLHAGYERLSSSQRAKINKLIKEQLEAGVDEISSEHLDVYRNQNLPDDLFLDEAHAILGTEQLNLSPELSEYYSKYFQDRSRVVKLNSSYAKVFKDIENQLSQYKTQLDQYSAELDGVQARIGANNSRYLNLNSQADAKLGSGDIAGYNSLVPQINAIVDDNVKLDAQQRSIIANHNKTADEYNKLIDRLNLLNKSIDPKQAEEVSS
jgi:hypothetical protein